MKEAAYAAIERRALAHVAKQRGRAAAARLTPEGQAIRALAEFEAHIGEAEIASFDVFDTLLRRRGLAPEAIMRKTAGFARAIAGRAAGEAIFAARPFLADRMKSAMMAAGRGDEPRLEDVFEAALVGSGLGPEVSREAAKDLTAFEVEVEARGLVADPEAAPLLRRLKERGLRVIAVSDMYFSGADVEALLERAGLRRHFDEVFVSSDLGWTKHGGRIFDIVRERLGAPASRILHTGDRADSDAAAPRAAGWRALHFVDEAGVAETEARRIEESHVPSPGLRRRRLEAALDLEERRRTTTGAIARDLIGPACGLLAMNALGLARRRGAARVHHLTRDATVIRLIAEEARRRYPHLAPGALDLRDLAMSRAMGARLQTGGALGLSRVRELTRYLTGEDVSAVTVASAFGLPETEVASLFGAATGDAFAAAMSEGAASSAILGLLEGARSDVVAYLENEGLLDAGPVVAVDIGYSGTFGVQLSEILAERPAQGRSVDFLFLATSRYIRGNQRLTHPSVRLRPGVALDHRERSARWPTRNFAWLEPFLTDPDRGKLLSVGRAGARFAESPFDEAERARRGAIRDAVVEGALAFIDRFHDAPGDLEEAGALVRRRLIRFAGRPGRAEAATANEFQHQEGMAALTLNDVTRPVSWLRLPTELGALEKEDRWVQGSLARSGLGVLNRVMAGAPEPDRRADPRMMWD